MILIKSNFIKHNNTKQRKKIIKFKKFSKFKRIKSKICIDKVQRISNFQIIFPTIKLRLAFAAIFSVGLQRVIGLGEIFSCHIKIRVITPF